MDRRGQAKNSEIRSGQEQKEMWDDDDFDLIDTLAANRYEQSHFVAKPNGSPVVVRPQHKPGVEVDSDRTATPASENEVDKESTNASPTPRDKAQIARQNGVIESLSTVVDDNSLKAAVDALETGDSYARPNIWPAAASIAESNTRPDTESDLDLDTEFDDIDLLGGIGFADAQEEESECDGEWLDGFLDSAVEIEGDEDDEEENESALGEIDVGGTRLDRYGIAQRLAYETLLTTDLDRETAFPVLLDIFYESPWARTRRSIEELAAWGVTSEMLALATQIRRVWRDHPEFAQAVSVGSARMAWYQNPEALGNLSWMIAANLADSWASYPDIDEVEHTLETLFDAWSCHSQLRRQFLNFRLLVTYLADSVKQPLDTWMAEFYDAMTDWEDPVCVLEQSVRGLESRDELARMGVELPRVMKMQTQKKGDKSGDGTVRSNAPEVTERPRQTHEPDTVQGCFRYGWFDT